MLTILPASALVVLPAGAFVTGAFVPGVEATSALAAFVAGALLLARGAGGAAAASVAARGCLPTEALAGLVAGLVFALVVGVGATAVALAFLRAVEVGGDGLDLVLRELAGHGLDHLLLGGQLESHGARARNAL